MKRTVFWVVAVCMSCVCLTTEADNVIREARKTIKDSKYEDNENSAKKVTENLNAAEKKLLEALPQVSETEERAEVYFTAALVECKLNDIENAKIYLQKAYDTTTFYSSIYKTYTYMAQCDSTEMTVPGRKKMKFRSKVREKLMDYRNNLLNGGRYYLKGNNYQEAFRYLNLYLSSAEYPMWSELHLNRTDSMYSRVAYWASVAGYNIGAYDDVVRFAPRRCATTATGIMCKSISVVRILLWAIPRRGWAD